VLPIVLNLVLAAFGVSHAFPTTPDLPIAARERLDQLHRLDERAIRKIVLDSFPTSRLLSTKGEAPRAVR
jgi:hypothetical protein